MSKLIRSILEAVQVSESSKSSDLGLNINTVNGIDVKSVTMSSEHKEHKGNYYGYIVIECVDKTYYYVATQITSDSRPKLIFDEPIWNFIDDEWYKGRTVYEINGKRVGNPNYPADKNVRVVFNELKEYDYNVDTEEEIQDLMYELDSGMFFERDGIQALIDDVGEDKAKKVMLDLLTTPSNKFSKNYISAVEPYLE